MKKEEKDLIIQDLGCRLYTDTQISIVCDSSDHGFQEGEYDNVLMPHHIEAFKTGTIDVFPYLRSIETITEEEHKELARLVSIHVDDNPNYETEDNSEWGLYAEGTGIKNLMGGARFYWNELAPIYDWFHKKHFNYRLPKELYIEAPDGMYTIK